MVQWIVSVVKRVVRGVSPGQAMTENLGYLLLAVAVSGIMPAAVATVTSFVDSAAQTLLGEYVWGLTAGGSGIIVTLALIAAVPGGGGAMIAIPIGLMLLAAIFGLWIMLIVRGALILLGLVFGPLVFAGLVDKDLWGHTRKWVGVMGGIIASKLGIFITLALAGALLEGIGPGASLSFAQKVGSCLTFLALLFVALFMPFQIAKWLPFVGDEIQAMAQVKDEAGQRAQAARQQKKQSQQNDMKNQADSKSSASGGAAGAGGAGGGAAAAGAGPLAAGMAIKEKADDMRDQMVQTAKDGAGNASGSGQPPQSGGGGQSPKGGGQQGGGQGTGSSGRSGGSGGGPGASRGPVPPPPPRPKPRPGSGPGQPPPPPPR
ncbi:hypothetical protein [Streptomyces sp. NBC_00470]|uniref:hypothetical protein n=1 Tax=Streptomyces sp. NBC_00470 TaxID=2975753 RepID=UPI0030E01714